MTTNELLAAGLAITVVGMGLVFAGLALLWGLIILLGRLFAEQAAEKTTAQRISTPEASGVSEGPLAVIVPLAPTPVTATPPSMPPVAAAPEPSLSPEAALTAERARVAALVAGALLANALPMLFEAPAGPTFEHGRTAPLWVAANRARALPTWQPARRPDSDRTPESLA